MIGVDERLVGEEFFHKKKYYSVHQVKIESFPNQKFKFETGTLSKEFQVIIKNKVKTG